MSNYDMPSPDGCHHIITIFLWTMALLNIMCSIIIELAGGELSFILVLGLIFTVISAYIWDYHVR